MLAHKSSALVAEVEADESVGHEDLDLGMEELSSRAREYIEKLREFRLECYETADELRLLDSRLDGLSKK